MTQAPAPQIAADAGAPRMLDQTRVSAYALLMSGQYVAALNVFESQDPKTAETYNQIGIAAEHMFMVKKAKESFEEALKLRPRFAEADNNLGTLYYSEKDYGKAAKYYKKSLRIDRNDAYTLSNLGTLYFSEKKYRQGAKAYRQAFALNAHVFQQQPASLIGAMVSSKSRAELHFAIARMMAQSGMPHQAMIYLQKAVSEGFNDRWRLMKDNAFASLRAEPQFTRLLKTMNG